MASNIMYNPKIGTQDPPVAELVPVDFNVTCCSSSGVINVPDTCIPYDFYSQCNENSYYPCSGCFATNIVKLNGRSPAGKIALFPWYDNKCIFDYASFTILAQKAGAIGALLPATIPPAPCSDPYNTPLPFLLLEPDVPFNVTIPSYLVSIDDAYAISNITLALPTGSGVGSEKTTVVRLPPTDANGYGENYVPVVTSTLALPEVSLCFNPGQSSKQQQNCTLGGQALFNPLMNPAVTATVVEASIDGSCWDVLGPNAGLNGWGKNCTKCFELLNAEAKEGGSGFFVNAPSLSGKIAFVWAVETFCIQVSNGVDNRIYQF